METIEQINDEFNVKKPKKKCLIIGGIIAAVIVIALILVYFLVFAKPQFIFNKAIDKLFAIEAKDVKSVKSDLEMKVSLEAKNLEIQSRENDIKTVQEQLDQLEKFTLKIGSQVDLEGKEKIVSLGLEYDNQSVIDVQGYYNEEAMYIYLEELFDKYIKVELEEEQKQAIKTVFETTSNDQLQNSKKAVKAVRDELKAQIKEQGELEKEKVEIEIGDKEEKVTKSTLILSQKELIKVISSMCSNLAKDDEFLEAFDRETKKVVKEELKEFSEELEDVDTNSKNILEISIYTKGLLNKFIGIDIQMKSEDETGTITILKEDKDMYTFNVQLKSEGQKTDLMSGKIEVEKNKNSKNEQIGKTIITVEMPEMGEMKLEIDYSFIYNQGIDKVDTRNSINATELTEEDGQKILEKLSERPLIGDILKTYLFENNESQDNITDGSDDITTPNITTSQNEVKDNMYGYSVKYSVPEGFKYESDYSYDYEKRYTLEEDDSEIEADVSLSWDTDEEYKKDNIDWDYNYYKDSTYYQNVKLGDIKTIKVGNKEFKYQILSYESNSEFYNEKYQIAYAWCNLDDEHVFSVQLESTNKEISEDIIKGFLNINISKI